MTAWQRSNITLRSEKGFGPISFKRLLIAGGTGGLIAMIGGRVIGFGPGCLSAFIVLVVMLVITHPVEGLPLFSALLRSLRGLAAVGARQGRGGLLSLVGRVMQVSAEDGMLDADDAYDMTWEVENEDDVLDSDWEYLGGFADVKREGLSAAANPFVRRDIGEDIDG
jgi:hypothetical protein